MTLNLSKTLLVMSASILLVATCAALAKMAINRSDRIWDDVATKRPRSKTRLSRHFSCLTTIWRARLVTAPQYFVCFYGFKNLT